MDRRVLFGIGAIVLAIPLIAAAVFLIGPYFDEDEVDEEFDFEVATRPPDTFSAQATLPEGVDIESAEATMVAAATQQPPTAEDPMPEEIDEMPEEERVAFLIKQGICEGADAVHTCSGDVLLFQLPDESYVLRFENFRVTNGPDLIVLASFDGTMNNTVNLGQLRGNSGSLTYNIPSDVDAEAIQQVIIYCEPFSVTFATADLLPPSAGS